MTTPPGFSRRALLARERLSRSARWVTVQLLMITTSAGSDGETISNPSATAVRTTEAESAKFTLQPTVRTLRRFRIRSSRLREPHSLRTGRGPAKRPGGGVASIEEPGVLEIGHDVAHARPDAETSL